MFGSRTIKIWRDVWSRKIRTLLVSSSIFIGVFGVVTLFSTGEILINQLNEDLDQNRLAMIRMRVTVSAGAQVDNAAYLETLNDPAVLPGIETVEGRAVYPLFWRLPGEDRFQGGTLAAYTQPFDQTVLEPPRLIDGAYPQAGQGQIAIERRMAEAEGLGVGDTLDLRILSQSEAAANNGAVHSETWTITGIIFQPYGEIGGTGPLDPKALVYAAYDDAQHIAGFTGLSIIYARYQDFATADAEIANFKAAVANNTPYVPTFTIVEDPAQNSLIESTRTTNRILVILAMVALVVSGFLVINVINSIVVEQRRQIGVMKSLGATRLDNFFIYSGVAVMYGLLGVIPGVLLGIPGGYYAAKGLATQSGTIIENFAISPTGILIGVVVGLAVPFLASVLPVINGTRVSILEAMTDLGIDASYGQGPLARLIARLPMPLTLRQAVNNVNRKKFRLALTGTTLTVAVGAFMGIFAVFSSLGDVIDNVFSAFSTQISISPNEGQRLETMRSLLTSDSLQAALADKGLPALKSVNPGANLSIEIEGYNPPPINAGPPGIFALGIDTTNPEIARFDFKSGTGWNDDPAREGVVVSSRIADIMGKQVGDRIVILAGGGRGEYTIIGITSYPFDTVWMKWEDLSRLGGLVTGVPTAADYGMNTTAVEAGGEQIGALGLDTEFVRFLSYVDGAAPTPGESQMIVNTNLAEAQGYKVGDTLAVTLAGNTRDFTISGVFELPAQVTSNPNHPTEVLGIYWQDLARLEGRSFDGEPYPNSIDLILAGGDPSVKTVDNVIDVLNETLLEQGITAEFTNWVEFQETITRFIAIFNVILNLAAGLIAAVGAIGLLTSLSMSVFERQKEIGVMRSVGASSGSIALQFLIEGLVVGVVAWAIGIPLSYVLGQGLIAALPFEQFGIGFPLLTLIVGLAGMLIVVTLASLWPSLAAARRTVSDILRYQ
jgi:ABC-type antimicrobial peptide transport system permease subunit